MKPRSQLAVLALAALFCAIVGGLFLLKRSGDEAQAAEIARRFAAASEQAQPSQIPVQVTVLGDDLAAPAQSGTPVAVFPTLLQRDLGVRVVSLSTAGTGYTTRPLTNMYGGTLAARAEQVAPESKVILVVGGANDQRATRVQLLRAASQTISEAQQRAPDSQVVVVGPVSTETAVPESLLAVRDALREAAVRGEATFVDPIAQGWLTGGTGFVGDDERTLTSKGQQEMATRLEVVLRPLL